jgi:hypothetical protein
MAMPSPRKGMPLLHAAEGTPSGGLRCIMQDVKNTCSSKPGLCALRKIRRHPLSTAHERPVGHTEAARLSQVLGLPRDGVVASRKMCEGFLGDRTIGISDVRDIAKTFLEKQELATLQTATGVHLETSDAEPPAFFEAADVSEMWDLLHDVAGGRSSRCLRPPEDSGYLCRGEEESKSERRAHGPRGSLQDALKVEVAASSKRKSGCLETSTKRNRAAFSDVSKESLGLAHVLTNALAPSCLEADCMDGAHEDANGLSEVLSEAARNRGCSGHDTAKECLQQRRRRLESRGCIQSEQDSRKRLCGDAAACTPGECTPTDSTSVGGTGDDHRGDCLVSEQLCLQDSTPRTRRGDSGRKWLLCKMQVCPRCW